MKKFLILALAPLPALFFAAAISAETLREKSESDRTIGVSAEDGEMGAAFGKARQNFPAFVQALDAGKDDPQSFAVKLRIVDGDAVEYFWAFDVKRSGAKFTAILNDESERIRNVQYGEATSFAASDVYDWMYRAGDNFVGNYTACALLAHEPADEVEALKQQYGIACEQDRRDRGARG